MPTAVTYPGVYIEEISSGVRTITGVATSITAFIGRAKRGQVNQATTINSYGDYERIFGGLALYSSMSYAVRDFFLNGGSKAVIVRLYHSQADKPSKTKLIVGNLKFIAANEGAWGMQLRASINTDVSEDVATRMGLVKGDLFNLIVKDTNPGGATERFLNVSLKDSPRRIDKVLAAESKLVRWDKNETLPNTLPTATDDDLTSAEKKLADKTKHLEEVKKANPPVQANIDTANAEVNSAQSEVSSAKAAMEASDGADLTKDDFTPTNAERDKKGLYALEQVDLFNLLCIPPYLSTSGLPNRDIDVSLVSDAATYCEKRRAMLLVDPPSDWDSKSKAVDQFKDPNQDYIGTRSNNATLFFPRLKKPNPLSDNQIEEFVPCGTIAGLFSRIDTQRGVWKAPAGIEATLLGVPELSVNLTNDENGELNPLGINCLRSFPIIGRVAWGSRTLRGADQLADEYKYIPVRRLALFIEESLFRGTQWVVFEPNDEPLWAQIRLNVGAFMHNLFRQGAFKGSSPREAYFVKCDKETTIQNDINLGIVNIVVGFAPLKPAEFVIIKLQQIAGNIEV
ncbi:MAG: phage tail sheath family protein [Thioploca sp.]|nr:phage tail sheath family protein [Thioploca sp.]